MNKKYPATLTEPERQLLADLIARGKGAARRLAHARILLKAARGLPDEQIAQAVAVSIPTVERVRRRGVAEGQAAALDPRRPARPRPRKLDGRQEAHLPDRPGRRGAARRPGALAPALAGRAAGRARPGRQPLARDGAAPAQNNQLKPGLKGPWGIPPRANAAFVYPREAGLDVSTRPADPRRPRVGEVRPPRPRRAGRRATTRSTSAKGWATASCSTSRCAAAARGVSPSSAPAATGPGRPRPDRQPAARGRGDRPGDGPAQSPGAAALDEAFPPAEAQRLAAKLASHPTPKPGRGLNRAESELSILRRQCLARRVPDRATLAREVAAWHQRREALGGTIEWRFTTADARIKFKHLYPSVQA